MGVQATATVPENVAVGKFPTILVHVSDEMPATWKYGSFLVCPFCKTLGKSAAPTTGNPDFAALATKAPIEGKRDVMRNFSELSLSLSQRGTQVV